MAKTYTAAELKLMLVEAEERELNARNTRDETAQRLFTKLADINPRLADKALAKLQRFADHASRKSSGAPSKTGARHRRAEPSSRSQKRDDGVSHTEPQTDEAAGSRGNA